MPKSREPSLASSPAGGVSPGRHKPRRSRSICSTPSVTSGRLTSIIDQYKDKNLDSFALSPLSSRLSVLTNKTDIEEPRRRSWWKNLKENSIDIMEVLGTNKVTNVDKTVEELVEFEVMSEEDKNYTLRFSESSDNESVKSIVLPPRNLFNQKDNILQKKFGQIVGARENLTKLHKTTTKLDKTVITGTRKLFKGAQGSQPVFPAELLSTSPNIPSKSKQNVAEKSLVPIRNIFATRPNNKRKNIFADFILTESEDEISDIQPKIFGFRKQTEFQNFNVMSKDGHSPTSTVSNDTELDDWKHLPSSTMVDSQFDQTVIATPVKRARLSRPTDVLLSEVNENCNKSKDFDMEKSHNEGDKVNKNYTHQEMDNKLNNITEKNNDSHGNENNNYRSQQLEDKNGIQINQNDTHKSQELGDIDESSAIKNNDNAIQESKGRQKIQVHESTESECQELRGSKESQEKLNIECESHVLNREKSQDSGKNNTENPVLENTIYKSQEIKSYNEIHGSEGRDKNNENKNNELKCQELNGRKESPVKQIIRHESREFNRGKSEENEKIEVESKVFVYTDEHGENEKQEHKNQDSKHKAESQALEDRGDSQKNEKNEYENQESEYRNKSKEKSNNEYESQELEDNDSNQKDENSECEVNESEFRNKNQEKQNHGSLELETGDDSQKNYNNEGEHLELEYGDKSQLKQNEEYEIPQIVDRDRSQESEKNENKRQGFEYRGEHQENDNNEDEWQKIRYRDKSREKQCEKRGSQKLGNRDNQEKQNKERGSYEIRDTDASMESEKDESERQVLEYRDELQKNDNNDDEHRELKHKNHEKQNEERGSHGLGDRDGSQEIKEIENERQELEYGNVHHENLYNEYESQNSENRDKNQKKQNNDYDNQELEEGDKSQVNKNSEQEGDEIEDSECKSNESSDRDSQESEDRDISQENGNNQYENEESEDNTDEIQGIENVNENNEEQNLEDSNNVEHGLANNNTSEQNQEEMTNSDENEDENDEIESIPIEEQSLDVSKSIGSFEKNAPEVILDGNINQQDSFMMEGRDTSNRKTKSMYKDLNIRPSLAPPRDSLGVADGTADSSAEGSGWDSHRTTRKTLRQTFGKDFTPRKSLRALVTEKSAKLTHTLHSETAKFPLANSTECTPDSDYEDNMAVVSDHEESRRERIATLENYLQKIKQQNLEKKQKLEESIRNSFKAPPAQDLLNLFKVPSKPPARKVKPASNKPKKQIKPNIFFEELPAEVVEDMKYKPPKRFRPSNASWITKRLYKFLESKLEPKYDYRARVRAEKLVETLYNFTKDLRRQNVAPVDSVKILKQEFARLDIVRTHFEFYEFFHEFMPREVRVKVVPDIVNKIPLPRHGVFTDILKENTVPA